ncbi:hypothetical protein LEP3755_03370 [Leptolyngbya sp. NIES-3755]|nr:hypothetical protein LEP3755_03370 [Leptolyngbya sp. NIES-3755]
MEILLLMSHECHIYVTSWKPRKSDVLARLQVLPLTFIQINKQYPDEFI